MSRTTWAEAIEDMNAKLEDEKSVHKTEIRRLEDMIIKLHHQIKANKKDLEDIKKGK